MSVAAIYLQQAVDETLNEYQEEDAYKQNMLADVEKGNELKGPRRSVSKRVPSRVKLEKSLIKQIERANEKRDTRATVGQWLSRSETGEEASGRNFNDSRRRLFRRRQLLFSKGDHIEGFQSDRPSFTSLRRFMTRTNSLAAGWGRFPVMASRFMKACGRHFRVDVDVTLTKWTRIVHPNELWRKIWDGVVLVLVLYSVVMVPFQISYGAELAMGIFNNVGFALCGFFAVDIVIIFRTAYYNSQGVLVRSGYDIATRYVKFWFWIDLAASIPFDAIGKVFVENGGSKHSQQILGLNMIKMLRLLRLGRLLRILDQWKGAKILDIVKLFLVMCLLSHWLSCVWYLLFVFQDEPLKMDWSFTVDNGTEESVLTYYLTNYYHSFLLLVGENMTAYNNYERTYMVIVLVLGTFLYSAIVGHMAMLVATMNIAITRHGQKLITMQDVLRYLDAPDELRDKVQNYFEYLQQQSHPGAEGFAFLSEITPCLRSELASFLHGRHLSKNPLFEGCEEGFMVALALRTKVASVQPKEVIFRKGDVGREMYTIRKGCVAVLDPTGAMLKLLPPGEIFGELALLSTGRRTATCVALGFVDLAMLSRMDVEVAMRDYPTSAAIIRQRAASKAQALKTRKNIWLDLDEDLEEDDKGMFLHVASSRPPLPRTKAAASPGQSPRGGTRQSDDGGAAPSDVATSDDGDGRDEARSDKCDDGRDLPTSWRDRSGAGNALGGESAAAPDISSSLGPKSPRTTQASLSRLYFSGNDRVPASRARPPQHHPLRSSYAGQGREDGSAPEGSALPQPQPTAKGGRRMVGRSASDLHGLRSSPEASADWRRPRAFGSADGDASHILHHTLSSQTSSRSSSTIKILSTGVDPSVVMSKFQAIYPGVILSPIGSQCDAGGSQGTMDGNIASPNGRLPWQTNLYAGPTVRRKPSSLILAAPKPLGGDGEEMHFVEVLPLAGRLPPGCPASMEVSSARQGLEFRPKSTSDILGTSGMDPNPDPGGQNEPLNREDLSRHHVQGIDPWHRPPVRLSCRSKLSFAGAPQPRDSAPLVLLVANDVEAGISSSKLVRMELENGRVDNADRFMPMSVNESERRTVGSGVGGGGGGGGAQEPPGNDPSAWPSPQRPFVCSVSSIEKDPPRHMDNQLPNQPVEASNGMRTARERRSLDIRERRSIDIRERRSIEIRERRSIEIHERRSLDASPGLSRAAERPLQQQPQPQPQPQSPWQLHLQPMRDGRTETSPHNGTANNYNSANLNADINVNEQGIPRGPYTASLPNQGGGSLPNSALSGDRIYPQRRPKLHRQGTSSQLSDVAAAGQARSPLVGNNQAYYNCRTSAAGGKAVSHLSPGLGGGGGDRFSIDNWNEAKDEDVSDALSTGQIVWIGRSKAKNFKSAAAAMSMKVANQNQGQPGRDGSHPSTSFGEPTAAALRKSMLARQPNPSPIFGSDSVAETAFSKDGSSHACDVPWPIQAASSPRDAVEPSSLFPPEATEEFLIISPFGGLVPPMTFAPGARTSAAQTLSSENVSESSSNPTSSLGGEQRMSSRRQFARVNSQSLITPPGRALESESGFDSGVEHCPVLSIKISAQDSLAPGRSTRMRNDLLGGNTYAVGHLPVIHSVENLEIDEDLLFPINLQTTFVAPSGEGAGSVRRGSGTNTSALESLSPFPLPSDGRERNGAAFAHPRNDENGDDSNAIGNAAIVPSSEMKRTLHRKRSRIAAAASAAATSAGKVASAGTDAERTERGATTTGDNAAHSMASRDAHPVRQRGSRPIAEGTEDVEDVAEWCNRLAERGGAVTGERDEVERRGERSHLSPGGLEEACALSRSSGVANTPPTPRRAGFISDLTTLEVPDPAGLHRGPVVDDRMIGRIMDSEASLRGDVLEWLLQVEAEAGPALALGRVENMAECIASADSTKCSSVCPRGDDNARMSLFVQARDGKDPPGTSITTTVGNVSTQSPSLPRHVAPTCTATKQDTCKSSSTGNVGEKSGLNNNYGGNKGSGIPGSPRAAQTPDLLFRSRAPRPNSGDNWENNKNGDGDGPNRLLGYLDDARDPSLSEAPLRSGVSDVTPVTSTADSPAEALLLTIENPGEADRDGDGRGTSSGIDVNTVSSCVTQEEDTAAPPSNPSADGRTPVAAVGAEGLGGPMQQSKGCCRSDRRDIISDVPPSTFSDFFLNSTRGGDQTGQQPQNSSQQPKAKPHAQDTAGTGDGVSLQPQASIDAVAKLPRGTPFAVPDFGIGVELQHFTGDFHGGGNDDLARRGICGTSSLHRPVVSMPSRGYAAPHSTSTPTAPAGRYGPGDLIHEPMLSLNYDRIGSLRRNSVVRSVRRDSTLMTAIQVDLEGSASTEVLFSAANSSQEPSSVAPGYAFVAGPTAGSGLSGGRDEEVLSKKSTAEGLGVSSSYVVGLGSGNGRESHVSPAASASSNRELDKEGNGGRSDSNKNGSGAEKKQAYVMLSFEAWNELQKALCHIVELELQVSHLSNIAELCEGVLAHVINPLADPAPVRDPMSRIMAPVAAAAGIFHHASPKDGLFDIPADLLSAANVSKAFMTKRAASATASVLGQRAPPLTSRSRKRTNPAALMAEDSESAAGEPKKNPNGIALTGVANPPVSYTARTGLY